MEILEINIDSIEFSNLLKEYTIAYEEKDLDIYSKKEYSFRNDIPNISREFFLSAQQMLEIKPHVDQKFFPNHLFIAKSPQQTDEEFEYAKNNYKAITAPSMSEFFNSLNRIMARNLSNIDFKENEELKEYTEKELPKHKSLTSFFKNICLPDQLKDPNSVLIVRPLTLPTKENQEGELIIDQSKEIKPTTIIMDTLHVPLFLKDNFCLVLTDEKSLVDVGGKIKKEGFIYEFYDKNTIYRIIQQGEKKDYKFKIVTFWQHNLNKLPVIKLGRQIVGENNHYYFKSDIYPAVEPFDIALLDNSTLTIVKYKIAYPHTWVVTDQCSNEDCENGVIAQEDGSYIPCNQCSSQLGPLIEHKLKPLSDPSASDQQIPNPPIGFAAPEPDILMFLRKEIEIHIAKGEKQLKLNQSNSSVKGSEAALSKMIDRESTFTFIKGISDHNFDLLRWSYEMISLQYQGEDKQLPIVTEPDTFEIKSSSDLSEEYNESVKSGMPTVINGMLLFQYVDKKFANDPKNEQIIKTQQQIDRLIFMSPENIIKGLATKNITRVEKIVHDSYSYFYQNELNKDSSFPQKTIEEQKTIIFSQAQLIDDQIQSELVNVTPAETQPPNIS